MQFAITEEQQLVQRTARDAAERLLAPKAAQRDVTSEFPLHELVFPGNFGLYMDHLNSLSLAGIWQDGNQETIMEGMLPRQTGVNIKNLVMLVGFGRMFAQACVPDNLNPQWVQSAKDA